MQKIYRIPFQMSYQAISRQIFKSSRGLLSNERLEYYMMKAYPGYGSRKKYLKAYYGDYRWTYKSTVSRDRRDCFNSSRVFLSDGSVKPLESTNVLIVSRGIGGFGRSLQGEFLLVTALEAAGANVIFYYPSQAFNLNLQLLASFFADVVRTYALLSLFPRQSLEICGRL